ncbi:MAG: hypothetical protein IKV16_05490 [Clostridia bacterium]|nr:hypothetical protein [Clostridia bacterium]
MNIHKYFCDKKTEKMLEYLSENYKAERGRRITLFSLITILCLRIFLALFEIPVFILLAKPINALSVLFVFPVYYILRSIYKGAKALSYLLLLGATLRLITFSMLVLGTLPDRSLTAFYTVLLFIILLCQFFISLFILVNFDCDTYFSAMQRISIKLKNVERRKKSRKANKIKKEKAKALDKE